MCSGGNWDLLVIDCEAREIKQMVASVCSSSFVRPINFFDGVHKIQSKNDQEAFAIKTLQYCGYVSWVVFSQKSSIIWTDFVTYNGSKGGLIHETDRCLYQERNLVQNEKSSSCCDSLQSHAT